MTFHATFAAGTDAVLGTASGFALTFSPHPAGLPSVIRFPAGLPGFEMCQGFVIKTTGDNGPLQCLESVDGETAFLVIDPRRVLPDYRCTLSDADRHALEAESDDTLLWMAMVTAEDDGTVAVNLRAPVVVNPGSMLGHQIVPHESIYPLRHVIIEAGGGA